MIGRWLAFLTAQRGGTTDESPARHGGAWFRALAEMEAAAVFIFDAKGLQYVNPALQALTGRSRDDLARLDFWELAHADFQAALRDSGRACLRGDTTHARCEVKLAGEGGRWIDVTITPVGAVRDKMAMGLALDITGRKQAAEAHQESERRLREILEHAPDAVLFVDKTGEVTYCNEHLLTLLGYAAEEVVGQNWFDRFVPENERAEEKARFLERVEEGMPPSRGDGSILTRKGEKRRIAWSSTALRDGAGRVVGAAHLGSDLTERKKAEDARRWAGLFDELTGLPNRTLLTDRISASLARARQRPSYRFAVMVVDMDRFKIVNDSLGRLLGDRLLVEIGQRLAGCVRPTDTLAHLEGDAFAMLIDDLEHSDVPSRVADRVQGALTVPFQLGGHEVFTTASIGIAHHRPRYHGPEEILRDADIAMHHAKSQGKGRQQEFQTAMHARTVVRLQLENDLHRALERGELSVYYQPIRSLRTGGITGLEALLRWERPHKGQLMPAEFLQIAEESGLIVPIGSWVLREACRQLRSWQDAFPGAVPLTMSVNMSPRQFGEPELVQKVEAIVRQAGVASGSVKLEITESVLMENPDSAARMLGELRAGGIDVCIDDFGTGYSSLSYLLRLPAQTLKIDRSFVSDMPEGGKRAEMVRAIVGLARSLEMDVTAEGVETEQQLAGLRQLDCDHVQGYLISPPLDADGASALLMREGRS